MRSKKYSDGGRLRKLRMALIAPLSLLLMYSTQNILINDSSIVTPLYSPIYAHEDVLVQECKARARDAHLDREANIKARARRLGAVPVITGIVFTSLSAAAGVLSLGTLALPIALIGAGEIAWMVNEIETQEAEAIRQSGKQWSQDETKCVEDAIRLQQELSVLDLAESTFRFDFTSGAVLGGLVSIPNGIKTKTSVTHIGVN